jgi:hypothetical protein
MGRKLVLGVFAGVSLALAACRTERSSSPPGLAAAQPILLDVARSWRVLDGGEVLGIVVQFENEPRRGQPRSTCFSVQNVLQQELGRIDGLGRAWRHEPHEREPLWVGTGTVIEGARAILGASPNAVLDETFIRADRTPDR